MAESVRTATVLLVSPDPVQRDELVEGLRGHLGGSCRVIGAGGVREAADVLTHLTVEGTAVALAISEHRLPDGSGVDLFGHIGIASPATRRILLTTMDQADAALQAINQSQVDRYVVLPAEPVEDRLLPMVDDLLTDWFAQHSAAQVGVTVDTVRTWRGRFAEHGLAGLMDRPRSGRPSRFSPVQIAQVTALACQLPARRGAVGAVVVSGTGCPAGGGPACAPASAHPLPQRGAPTARTPRRQQSSYPDGSGWRPQRRSTARLASRRALLNWWWRCPP